LGVWGRIYYKNLHPVLKALDAVYDIIAYYDIIQKIEGGM